MSQSHSFAFILIGAARNAQVDARASAELNVASVTLAGLGGDAYEKGDGLLALVVHAANRLQLFWLGGPSAG